MQTLGDLSQMGQRSTARLSHLGQIASLYGKLLPQTSSLGRGMQLA